MSTDVLNKRSLEERATREQLIANYAAAAVEEQRDLTPTELETIGKARARIAELDVQIAATANDLEMAEELTNKLRVASGMASYAPVEYARAGDLLWDMVHQDDPDARTRYGRYTKRAAQHLGFDKANTVAVAGGFNGLQVVPVVGPVLDPSPQGRPLFSAIGATDVTSLSFNRPRIVDPNFSTGVAPQGMEKAELVSKTWDIVAEQVKLTVVGGYINVSMLLEEMLAGSLDSVVSHMNRRLEYYTEIAAVAEIANTTAEVPLADTATAAEVQKAIADAAVLVGKNTGRLPTWIATGLDGWGRLMGLTDAAGRPLFPTIGAANAPGTGGVTSNGGSVMGLNLIVTFGITDTSMYVGNSDGLEIYERRLSLMSVLEPSVRGRQISVASAIGFYDPITTEATPTPTPALREGIVRIGP